MQIKNYIGILGVVLLAFTSCKNDDDQVIVDPLTIEEVRQRDQDSIESFLNTHYYEIEDRNVSGQEGKMIVFKEWSEEIGQPRLIELSSEILEKRVADFAGLEYEYYVLKFQQGGNELKASNVDFLALNYVGQYTDGVVFDEQRAAPIAFDLASAVQGFSLGLEGFSGTKDGPTITDGFPFYGDDYSLGAVFMPSALGYFDRPPAGIRNIEPLIFSFQILDVQIADHDGDGIPSKDEDIDGDGSPRDDDSDGDGIVDFRDDDDDDDGELTKDEIVVDGNGEITFTDSDNDGTPDYLDKDPK